jgi:hypothetical protein
MTVQFPSRLCIPCSSPVVVLAVLERCLIPSSGTPRQMKGHIFFKKKMTVQSHESKQRSHLQYYIYV